jgi:hypothetical protein
MRYNIILHIYIYHPNTDGPSHLPLTRLASESTSAADAPSADARVMPRPADGYLTGIIIHVRCGSELLSKLTHH